jgi:hypothetical protein
MASCWLHAVPASGSICTRLWITAGCASARTRGGCARGAFAAWIGAAGASVCAAGLAVVFFGRRVRLAPLEVEGAGACFGDSVVCWVADISGDPEVGDGVLKLEMGSG